MFFFIWPLVSALYPSEGEQQEGLDVISSFSTARPSERFIEDDSARERNRRSGRRSLRCERSAIPNHLWALLDDGLNYKRRSDPSDLPRLRCRRRRGGSSLTWPSPALVRAAIANGLILKNVDLPKSKLTPSYIGPGQGMKHDKSLRQIFSWKRTEIIFCIFYLVRIILCKCL